MRTDVKMQRVILLAAEQRDFSPLKEKFGVQQPPLTR